MERLFKSSLVPYTLSSEERMKSLLRCYCALDEHSVKAFNEMLKTQFLLVVDFFEKKGFSRGLTLSFAFCFSLLTLQRQILNILVENQGKKMAGDASALLMDKLAKLAGECSIALFQLRTWVCCDILCRLLCLCLDGPDGTHFKRKSR